MEDQKAFLGKIRALFQKLRVLLYDYPCSIGAGLLYGVLEAAEYVYWHDLDASLPFDADAALLFLRLFCLSALAAEICFFGKRRRRWCGTSAGLILAGAGAYFTNLTREDVFLGIAGMVWRSRAEEAVLGAALLLLVVIVYHSFRKQKLSFAEYMLRLSVQLLKVFLMYLLLMLGVGLVSVAIDSLFLNGDSSLVSVSVDLVGGVVLVPGVILALHRTEEEPGYFLEVLVQYVFCSLTICALVVVYLYLFSILITRELPSNEVFPILSMLFCLGMPVWMAAGCWNQESAYVRRLFRLPYVFAPLVGMQILAVGIRIWANGLTPARYTGVMLMVFEIGTLLLWHFRRERMERMLLLLGALLVVTFLLPGVNQSQLSDRWQRAWLERYYEKVEAGGQLSRREYERLTGAYEYLREDVAAADETEATETYNLQSEEFAAKLAQQDPEAIGLTQYERYSIHGCLLVDGLDVEAFRRMDMLDKADRFDDAEEKESVDFSHFRFVFRETGEVLEIDISDFAERCMEYAETHEMVDEEEWREYMRDFYRIPIDEDRVFYLHHFQVSYQKGIKDGVDYFEWSSIGKINGMLLQR